MTIPGPPLEDSLQSSYNMSGISVLRTGSARSKRRRLNNRALQGNARSERWGRRMEGNEVAGLCVVAFQGRPNPGLFPLIRIDKFIEPRTQRNINVLRIR